MLAGIEFGLLHLFPHRVNAFKDMVYFSNGETLFSETFIRFLASSPDFPFQENWFVLWGWKEKPLGVSFLWEVLKSKTVGTSQAGKSHWQSLHALCHCPVSAERGAVGTRLQRENQGHRRWSPFSYMIQISDPGDCGPVATHWSDAFWRQRSWARPVAFL